jgi:hypothetical protein
MLTHTHVTRHVLFSFFDPPSCVLHDETVKEGELLLRGGGLLLKWAAAAAASLEK